MRPCSSPFSLATLLRPPLIYLLSSHPFLLECGKDNLTPLAHADRAHTPHPQNTLRLDARRQQPISDMSAASGIRTERRLGGGSDGGSGAWRGTSASSGLPHLHLVRKSDLIDILSTAVISFALSFARSPPLTNLSSSWASSTYTAPLPLVLEPASLCNRTATYNPLSFPHLHSCLHLHGINRSVSYGLMSGGSPLSNRPQRLGSRPLKSVICH